VPLFWFCLAAILGIPAALYLKFPSTAWALSAAVLLVLTILEYKLTKNYLRAPVNKRVLRIPAALVLCAFCLGGWRLASQFPTRSAEINAEDSSAEAVVTGVVVAEPYIRGWAKYVLVKGEQAVVDGEVFSFPDLVLVTLPPSFTIWYGDRIELSREITGEVDPAGAWTKESAARFEMPYPQITFISSGNASRVIESALRFKRLMHHTIYSIMPFPESALLSGILLGIEEGIPDLLLEAYRASSTLHIIVISGFNVSIIAFFITRVFRWFLYPVWAIAATIFSLVLYMFMVGADPPVMRATLMGISALPAYYIGRKVIGIHNLTLTAAIMLLINPFLLWNISFQLSFAATLALLTIVDPLNDLIRRLIEKVSSENTADLLMGPAAILTSTAAASLAVFPILFQIDPSISSIGLLTNFLILPLQPVIMISGSITALIGMVIPAIGQLLAVIPWSFLALTNQIVIRFSMSPNARVPLPPWAFHASAALAVVILLSGTVFQIYRLTNPRPDSEQTE